MDLIQQRNIMLSLHLLRLASKLSLILLVGCLQIGVSSEEAPVLREKVFFSEQEAVETVLGKDSDIRVFRQAISSADAKLFSYELGRRLMPETVTFHVSVVPDETVVDGPFPGFKIDSAALILEEIGKYYPITKIVAVRSNGTVKDVRVMVYREPIGEGVRKRRWLKQFFNKKRSDHLQVDRNIHTITGATMSAWSVTDGVRRALAYIDAYLLNTSDEKFAKVP